MHSFWAYQLGVKADANPGVDNIVYVHTKGPRTFDIHCAELCGLWHGYMFDTGEVVDTNRVHRLDQAAAVVLRSGRAVPAEVLGRSICPTRSAAPDDHARGRSAVSTTAVETRAPLWRRLIGFNLLTGDRSSASAAITSAGSSGTTSRGRASTYFGDIDQNDISVLLGYLLGVIGFLIGLGFGVYPWARLRGYPPSLREKETQGVSRYFGLCTDHKVVGIQYLIGIGLFFFIGGLNAMLIRVELLRPSEQVFPAGQYLTLVGMHGTMMMGIMTSAILGPFANYFVPLMIGARRMAFPRIESLTFWLLMAAGAILTTTIFFGGFPTGWTGYEPLNARRTPAWTPISSSSRSSACRCACSD